MQHKAPGKSHRTGISLVQLLEMFPDEARLLLCLFHHPPCLA